MTTAPMRTSMFRESEDDGVKDHKSWMSNVFEFIAKRTTKRKPLTKLAKERRHFFIHHLFKPRLILPILKLVNKILGRFMVKDREGIPNEPYNKNFHILWDTFEEGMKEWWWTFKQIDKKVGEDKDRHILEWYDRKNTNWYWIPKLFLKLATTIALEDTAYREQMNFLMFRLQGNMNKAYKPEIKHEWPMYVGKYDNNVPYFLEFMKKSGGGSMTINISSKEDDAIGLQFAPKLIDMIKMVGGSVTINVPTQEVIAEHVQKPKDEQPKKEGDGGKSGSQPGQA